VLNQIKNGETKPTRIMYGANLSWKSLKEILVSLVAQGFVKEVLINTDGRKTKKRYEITDKGENVLQVYSKVCSLIEITTNQI
jgi:predicted transcriptional regulator